MICQDLPWFGEETYLKESVQTVPKEWKPLGFSGCSMSGSVLCFDLSFLDRNQEL